MTVLQDNPMQAPFKPTAPRPLCVTEADVDLHCSRQAALCSVSAVSVGRAGSEAFLLAFYKEIKGVSGMMIMMHQMESLPRRILLNHL